MFLVLFFRERLALAFAPTDELAEFQAGGMRYRDTGAGFLTSHYDRLTDPAGRLIGFVLWGIPAEAGVATMLAALPPRPQLISSSGCATGLGRRWRSASSSIMRRGPRSNLPGDQAFGGQCFRGPGAEFAVSIDLDYLLDRPRPARRPRGDPRRASGLARARRRSPGRRVKPNVRWN